MQGRLHAGPGRAAGNAEFHDLRDSRGRMVFYSLPELSLTEMQFACPCILRGKWLIEISGASHHSTRPRPRSLKAFLTQRKEQYTPKYASMRSR